LNKLIFFKDYLIEKYGTPLYRIPIDLPFSCPNREKNSGQGCIYCADDGNRARHLRHNLSLEKQVSEGIEYVQRRYEAKPPYIAYFQSYTNTYAPVEILRKYYFNTLAQADFKMVIISTRPDCLPDDVLDLLVEINQKYDLWVELGVQTSNDKTLEIINRGHDFESVKIAARKLAERNISCAAHVILGLPGENMKDFRQTAKDLSELPFSAIKLHNLLVLRKTPLAKLYADPKDFPPINPLNEYEYAEAATELLRLLPENWIIMRLTTDAPEKDIIAPKWWMKKGQFLEFFKEYFEKGKASGAFQGVTTQDGSQTLYHPGYRQHFHTLAGAETEAQKKFIEPSNLVSALRSNSKVKLLDVGFGLGYNAIEAAKTAEAEKAGTLYITTLENDIRALESALPLFSENQFYQTIIKSLLQSNHWEGAFCKISLLQGDARQSVKSMQHIYDIIFMDGFSPDKNPELWTYDFIRELCRLLTDNGIIVTYSSAYPVRGAMLRNGLNIGESDAFGRKRGGTVAGKNPAKITRYLNDKELNIISKSTAGAPYRDYGLNNKTKKIISRRSALITRLRSMGIPKWIK
jgi:radical SAM protein (TIGR01212 family)